MRPFRRLSASFRPRTFPAAAAALCGAALLAGCTADPHPLTWSKPDAGKRSAHPDSGDFNGDGYDDYTTVVNSASQDKKRFMSTLVVVYGSRDGLRTDWSDRFPAGRKDWHYEGPPLHADLNGDGFTDLAGTRAMAEQRYGFVMYGGARGLEPPRRVGGPDLFHPLAAADFDGDGHIDLLDGGYGGRGDPNYGKPGGSGRILYGPFDHDGGHRRSVQVDLSQEGYATPYSATTGDFDADGRAEAVLTYRFDSEEDETAPDGLTSVAYYEGGAEKDGPRGAFVRNRGPEAALDRAVSTFDGPATPGTGDADGDGIPDLLLPTPGARGGVTVRFGATSGLGTGRSDTALGTGRREDFGDGPVVGEVNGDGKPDVLVDTPASAATTERSRCCRAALPVCRPPTASSRSTRRATGCPAARTRTTGTTSSTRAHCSTSTATDTMTRSCSGSSTTSARASTSCCAARPTASIRTGRKGSHRTTSAYNSGSHSRARARSR